MKANWWTNGIQPYRHGCGCAVRVGPNWIEKVRCETHAPEEYRKVIQMMREKERARIARIETYPL